MMNGTVGTPYPGTRPFQRDDHDRFFGRKTLADQLADLWLSNRLTIASGPVASGKTSLLNAGAFPLISSRRRVDVLPVGRISYGATFPMAALPDHNPYTLALLRSWSPDGEAATRLTGMSVVDFVRRRAGRHDGTILAVLDQAEELLADSIPRTAHRRRFLSELGAAILDEPRLHLLIMVRDEAISLYADTLGGGARQSIDSLSPQDAYQAVTGPVAVVGRSISEDAAERLVTELRTSHITIRDGEQRLVVDDRVQPSLLQVVCSRLWREMPPNTRQITAADVLRYADTDTALAEQCSQVIAEVADDHEVPPGRLRSWLLHKLITESGTRGSAREGVADTEGMPTAAIRELADLHLLSSQRRLGSRWYELLTDRLIEPLRQARHLAPRPAKPGKYLTEAGRTLAQGELDVAQHYAEAVLRTSLATDLRLRAEAVSLLGNLAFERAKPAEAEIRYRDAANLYEAVRETVATAYQLAAVGQALLAQGRVTDAVKKLHAAVERIPKDLVIRTELARALWQLGEGGAAIAELTTVLGVDAGNLEALRARGEILAYLGEPHDAMRDLDRVTLHERPSTRAARGLALARLGDQSAADKEVEEAVADAPRNGTVLLYAARATAIGGDQDTAGELARRAVEAMDPALPPPQRKMALQELSGRR